MTPMINIKFNLMIFLTMTLTQKQKIKITLFQKLNLSNQDKKYLHIYPKLFKEKVSLSLINITNQIIIYMNIKMVLLINKILETILKDLKKFLNS